MRYYQAAYQCNLLRLLAILLILAILLNLGLLPTASPTPSYDWQDFKMFIAISALLIWLYWQLPILFLRRQGYSDHQIKRIKHLCDLAGVRQSKWQARTMRVLVLLLIGLCLFWVKHSPASRNLLLFIMKSDGSRALFYAILPAMAFRIRIAHLVLQRKMQHKIRHH